MVQQGLLLFFLFYFPLQLVAVTLSNVGKLDNYNTYSCRACCGSLEWVIEGCGHRRSHRYPSDPSDLFKPEPTNLGRRIEVAFSLIKAPSANDGCFESVMLMFCQNSGNIRIQCIGSKSNRSLTLLDTNGNSVSSDSDSDVAVMWFSTAKILGAYNYTTYLFLGKANSTLSVFINGIQEGIAGIYSERNYNLTSHISDGAKIFRVFAQLMNYSAFLVVPFPDMEMRNLIRFSSSTGNVSIVPAPSSTQTPFNINSGMIYTKIINYRNDIFSYANHTGFDSTSAPKEDQSKYL